jgi:anti-sigma factor RsiW
MKCNQFEQKLSDYLDGLMAASEAADFGQHALQCRGCRQLLDDVKSSVRECKATIDVEAPPTLETTLLMIPSGYGPLDCLAFEELITEFLDGFVPAPTYHRFEQHADTCSECSSLLTEVVYAVAACHSVHTYEEYDPPEELVHTLLTAMPQPQRSLRRRVEERLSAWASLLMPRTAQGAPWSFATASVLAFAMFGVLLFDFSDDRTLSGIYRQARVKAAEFYSEGTDIYAQKDQVVARIREVGSGIGEIWDTLGAEGEKEDAGKNQSGQSNSNRSAGPNQQQQH